jgi:hypothetical protein
VDGEAVLHLVLVERRRMRVANAGDARMLSLAVEAGQFFLRRLTTHSAGRKYRTAFLTWLWTAFRNEVGRGEGSAGLRFDTLEGDE